MEILKFFIFLNFFIIFYYFFTNLKGDPLGGRGGWKNGPLSLAH
jgi:hypothetical protein